jgi:hypothetical protein
MLQSIFRAAYAAVQSRKEVAGAISLFGGIPGPETGDPFPTISCNQSNGRCGLMDIMSASLSASGFPPADATKVAQR